ncbi:MAG TPA: serine/threonine-protein kinase, partial [Gemmatimonadales bacterium]
MSELAYLESGAVLQDRYEVLREVGRGGYSVVYAARDRQLGQTVALKLLMPPPAAARLARERMRREVQVVRGLTHPNIVAVYDFVDAGARSFIVMEYVAGPDLQVRVRDRGPLSPEEAGRLGQDVAAALDAAHRRGILHRDVKPQNVLLDPDGRARLTDFGSAKLETLGTLTQTGGLVGTLDYAAPEVIAGRRGDARSDIYGLGVTLHFALAARLPERPSPHLPAPPAPEGYRPRAFRPDLPVWLDSVIARATAAEPNDRFPTAAALGSALAERAEQDEFGPRSTVALLESCLVCGTPDPFGVGVCAACRGDARGGADMLVFVERTSRGPARSALV